MTRPQPCLVNRTLRWDPERQPRAVHSPLVCAANNPASPRKQRANKTADQDTPGNTEKNETAIPNQAETIARLKEAFKDNGDRELFKETKAWISGFYTPREGMSTRQKRSSLTSDAYFRREVTTPMDTVLNKYKKGEPWSGDLPSTFLHQPGQSNSKVMGTLLLIQRLDLISVPEMKYTHHSEKQSRAITQVEDRVTESRERAATGIRLTTLVMASLGSLVRAKAAHARGAGSGIDRINPDRLATPTSAMDDLVLQTPKLQLGWKGRLSEEPCLSYNPPNGSCRRFTDPNRGKRGRFAFVKRAVWTFGE
ncbi:hypothetical protein LZ31DRAFT_596375 [Colletotrichum somersetense]|nr:hypothetical protein LZ31DRAFT_596375 [Colletotrichum somersetense]